MDIVIAEYKANNKLFFLDPTYDTMGFFEEYDEIIKDIYPDTSFFQRIKKYIKWFNPKWIFSYICYRRILKKDIYAVTN